MIIRHIFWILLCFGFTVSCKPDKEDEVEPDKAKTLFIANRLGLHALNAENGTVKWTQKLAWREESDPYLYKGIVFISSEFKRYAVNAETGDIIWEHNDYNFAPWTVIGYQDMIFTTTGTGIVKAFNIHNGETVWSSAEYLGTLQGPVLGPLNISGDNLYINRSGIEAINISTGAFKWKHLYAIERGSRPLISGEMLFVKQGGGVWAIKTLDGSVLWRSTLTMSIIESSLKMRDGLLFCAYQNGSLYAINSKDGQKVWEYVVNGILYATPALDKNAVYLGYYTGGIHAVDIKSGKKKWDNYASERVYKDLTLAGNSLFFILGNAYQPIYDRVKLCAVDPETGLEKWSVYSLGGDHSNISVLMESGEAINVLSD